MNKEIEAAANCRAYGHHWESNRVVFYDDHWEDNLCCDRCGAIRVDRVSRETRKTTSRRYYYYEGYIKTKNLRPSEAKLELMQGHWNRQDGKTGEAIPDQNKPTLRLA